MNPFLLFENGLIADIFIETSAFNGVKRVASIVSEDLLSVTGKKSNVIDSLKECRSERVIIVATIGQSALVDSLSERKL